jgi:hypothetical protein
MKHSANTSQHQAEREVALRLARAGRKVDLLVATVRGTGYGLNDQVARQVDALRAHEAQVHRRLREMREADEAVWAEHGAELGRLLDELEAQMAIARARLADASRTLDDASAAPPLATAEDAAARKALLDLDCAADAIPPACGPVG